jgi:hypothetical protein
MKKIFRTAAILLMGLGMMTTFTACHSGSDTTPESTPVVEPGDNDGLVDSDQNYEVLATTNVDPRTATITFDGVVITPQNVTGPDANGNYTFTYSTNIPVDGNVTSHQLAISDPNFIAQQSTVIFGDNPTVTPVIQLSKASTPVDLTVDANGTTATATTIESDEQDVDGNAVAEMEIPAGTTITNSDNQPNDGQNFSITAYVPSTGPDATVENLISKLDENTPASELPSESNPVKLENPVMAVHCTPDGVSFATPITIRLAIPGAKSGFKFICTNNNDETPVKLQDGKAVITVEHFSDWVFSAITEITAVDVERDALKEGSYSNTSASNVKISVSYNKKVGNKIITDLSAFDADAQELIRTYLQTQLGSLTPTTQAKSTNITVHGNERADYLVRQTYKDVTYRFINEVSSKSIDVVVRRYCAVRNVINRTGITPTPVHGGGSN